MTAGAPALTALLDELDRLRAAAGTDTPWRVGQHYGIHVYGGPDGQSPVATCHWDADAEFAVAAVNAVPRLTAAVRAALALAESWMRYPQSPEERERNRYGAAMQDCGEALRSAITAALGPTP